MKQGTQRNISRSAPPRLTVPQRKILGNLAAGRHWQDGARGRSQHGGFTATAASLVRHGWAEYVDTHDGFRPLQITENGRAILGGGKDPRE